MATLQNERDKALQATVPRLIATSVTISSSAGAAFSENPDTQVVEPASMTLTANTTVFTNPTIKWYYASDADMVWHDFNISGNNIGTTRLLTNTTFTTQLGATGTRVFYKATAEQFGFRSSENQFEVVYYTSGADGKDAYHIRLDNESRFVLFKYDGTAKSGQLPLTAQTYVTKGATDVTVGTGYVVYSIQSSLGTPGVSVNSSTGVITVTSVLYDTNYVEVKAVISEPDMPVFTAYKKLYLYKQQEPSVAVDVNITQDYYYFEYANNTSTTNIAAWSTVTLTAEVTGFPGAIVTWSAKTFNAAGQEISGTETIFTANGNTCTVSAAQFVARGGANNKLMRVFATYSAGGTTATDVAFIIRKDGTNGTKLIVSSNTHFTYEAQADNSISSAEFQEEVARLTVIDLATGQPVDDTTGWSFTAVSDPVGATIDINGSGAGPYVAINGVPVQLRLTALAQGITSGTITITAAKNGETTLTYNLQTFSVNLPASGGHVLVFDPDGTIVLPVDIDGNVGYTGATRSIKVLNGGIDDTVNWTITKVDGPGVTSTLSNNIATVTNFQGLETRITFGTGQLISTTPISYNEHSSLVYNTSGTTCLAILNSDLTNVAPIIYYSTDRGETWSSYTLSTVPPGGSYTCITHAGASNIIFYKALNKFVYLFRSPRDSNNGRIISSTDGISWTAHTLPNNSFYFWRGMFEDEATGRLYVYDTQGYMIIHTADLTNWTTTTNATSTDQCEMAGYNGKFIKARSVSGTTFRAVYYSTNLTSWTDISNNYGLKTCYRLYQYKDLFIGNVQLGYGGTLGFQYIYGTPNAVWKNCNLVNKAGATQSLAIRGSGPVNTPYGTIIRSGAGHLYFTNNNFSSLERASIVKTTGVGVPTPVIEDSSVGNYLSTTASATIHYPGSLPQNTDGSYYYPTLIWNYTTNNHYFWKGAITPGNGGTESYITITATANNPDYGVLTGKIIVKKGTYVGDIYTLQINPGEIRLPCSGDGKVYASSYTASPYNTLGPSTVQYKVIKNGTIYAGNISGTVTTTTGITTTIVGSGTTNVGLLTVTNMTDNATEPGSIDGYVTVDGISGVSMAVSVPVYKVRDGTGGQGLVGALVSTWFSNTTAIYVKFNPSGTIEVKRGINGTYVWAMDWHNAVNTINPPGGSWWLKVVDGGSDTGDVLLADSSVNSSALNTYQRLDLARAFYLTNNTNGAHRVTIKAYFATDANGANAAVGVGGLELEVTAVALTVNTTSYSVVMNDVTLT